MAEPDLAELAQAVAERGSLIFHVQLARALAFDAMRADGREPRAHGLAVDVGRDGYEVVFLDDTLRRVEARVTFAADGAPLVEPQFGPASARQSALARAHLTAAAAAPRPEFGVIVVPPPLAAADAPIDAYLTPPDLTPTQPALDGYRRLRLSPDGARVLADEPLAAADREITGPKGTVFAALGRPVPSEMIVALGLRLGCWFEVLTPDTDVLWRVEGETVAPVTVPPAVVAPEAR